MEMHKIREIVLRDVKTDNDSSSLIAKIDDKGDLVLEGYDIGESPKEFWGDSDYEYWLFVSKEHKDTVLSLLIKEHTGGLSSFLARFRKKSIPKDYRDTVLLRLIKERFDSLADFSTWLKKKGIPSEFFNWV